MTPEVRCAYYDINNNKTSISNIYIYICRWRAQVSQAAI